MQKHLLIFILLTAFILITCDKKTESNQSEVQDSSIVEYPYDTTLIDCPDPDFRKACWGMNQFNIYKLEKETDFDFNLPMNIMHYKSSIGGKEAKITYYTPFDTLAQGYIIFDRDKTDLEDLYKPLREKYGKPVRYKKDEFGLDYAKWETSGTEIELLMLQGGSSIKYTSLKYGYLYEKYKKMEKQKDEQNLKDAV